MKSDKGQALVEFALVVLLFVLLVIGIYDFGRAFHAYHTIDHVGRETARMVSVEKSKGGLSNDEIRTYAENIATGIDKDALTVSPPVYETVNYTNAAGNAEEIEIVKITISYQLQLYFPIIGAIYDEDGSPTAITITLTDTTKMRVE
ncbi:TadE family protein [Bacillus sp. T3]|uniref:TadE/TadG family type IV pilus assembly protein n=1 Tax=Bacillus sp. T3 TaxID=467262 RepID=UPI00298174F9|nr:TadE family protein [Bacillus sp. T3]